jgi:hypothetical protein
MNTNRQIRGHLLSVSAALLVHHQGVVAKLEKPTSELLSQWGEDSWKVTIIHGCFGLASEAGEIVLDVLGSNIRGLIKELGDGAFYGQLVLKGCRDGAEKLGLKVTPEGECGFCPHSFQPHTDLQILQGNLVNAAKQVAFYNQPLDEHLDAIVQAARDYIFGLVLTAEIWGFSADDILIGNIRKLTGEDLSDEKGRYKDGYSDAAAKARVDESTTVADRERERYNAVCSELAKSSPEDRVDRLRHLTGDRPEHHLYDVRTGLVICAHDAFGSDFAKIVIDAVRERWESEIPGGLDLDCCGGGCTATHESEAPVGKDAGDLNDVPGEPAHDGHPTH